MGSLEPKFETDDERNYLETTIRIRDGFETKANFNQKSERSLSEVLRKKEYEKVKTIIEILQKKGSITPKEAELTCKKSAATTRRYMKLLVETGYVIQEGSTNNIVYKSILY